MDANLLFRVVLLAVLVATFSISAYFRKKAREEGGVIERKEEGIIVLVLRMVFGLPLLASLLLYLFYPQWLVWSAVALPIWLRWLFVVVAVLCVPILWWIFRSIGTNISETVLIKREHQLVTTGPYQWVRHPLYATALLLIFSFSIVAGNWFIFAYFVMGLLVFRYIVIPEEEKRLIEAFGEKYEDYQMRTGALLPKIFRGDSNAT
jgi:protein-S-isoprenylcysteine O-methyltransferase Ste14